MKITDLEWLKDSSGAFSYARVIGAISIISNLIWRFYMGVDGINTYPAAIVGCCGLICGCVLWACEIFRENKRVSVKIGDKDYGINLGEKE